MQISFLTVDLSELSEFLKVVAVTKLLHHKQVAIANKWCKIRLLQTALLLSDSTMIQTLLGSVFQFLKIVAPTLRIKLYPVIEYMVAFYA